MNTAYIFDALTKIKKAGVILLKVLTVITDGIAFCSMILMLGVIDYMDEALPILAVMLIFPMVWAVARDFCGKHFGWTVLPRQQEDDSYYYYEEDEEDDAEPFFRKVI